MSLSPRLYHDLDDFRHLDAVLASEGRGAGHIFYVHPGDLRWWLFYNFPEDEPWKQLYLWENEERQTVAWTLLSVKEAALDVFCLPKIHHSPELEQLIAWGVEQMTGSLREIGESRIYKHWNHPEDQALIAALEANGFSRGEHISVAMTRVLNESIPPATLPPGYQLRSSHGLKDLENRAAAQHSAFESELPMERYLQRFKQFMSSPFYDPGQDIVVEAPDGCIAAFAKIWIDPATRSGNFEPVGVHAAYQRRGLGRAVMLEGLRRMQTWGMEFARVGTGAAEEPAIRLYESAGFQIVARLPVYLREI